MVRLVGDDLKSCTTLGLLIVILFHGLYFRKQKTAFIGWVGERMSHNLMFRVVVLRGEFESVELYYIIHITSTKY